MNVPGVSAHGSSDSDQKGMRRLLTEFRTSVIEPGRKAEDLHIVYPGCGTDEVLEDVFPESRITYIDFRPEVIDWMRSYVESQPNRGERHFVCAVTDECHTDPADILFERYLGDTLGAIAPNMRPDSYALCVDNEGVAFDELVQGYHFRLERVIRNRSAAEMTGRNLALAMRGRFREIFSAKRTVTETKGIQPFATRARTEEELRQSGMADILARTPGGKPHAPLLPQVKLLYETSGHRPKQDRLNGEAVFVLRPKQSATA